MIDNATLAAEFSQDSMFPAVIFAYEPLAYSTQRFLVYSALASGGHVIFFSGTGHELNLLLGAN
ncbi:MAG: hypothetical protein M1365_02630 [Actinobacteria bacterium]|nr:hypothetical protein [Actinomycetota bacterium]